MDVSTPVKETLSHVELAQWRAFSLMSRQVMRAVEARLQRDAGISSADFEILDALANSPIDQARARELAEMLSWEKSRISHQVTRMVDRGLVRRVACDVDLRGSWVQLTKVGRTARESALPHYAAAVRDAYLSRLDSGQASLLAETALSVVTDTVGPECQREVDRLKRSLTP